MTTASQTMIARAIGHRTELHGLYLVLAGAAVVVASIVAHVAFTHVFDDGTEQAQ